MRVVAGIVAATVTVACSAGTEPSIRGPVADEPPHAITVIVGGDVMLGRGVEAVWRVDALAPVEGIRPEIRSADLAVANLESPLTDRPHLLGPDALEAPPETASVLTATGFDAMVVANNHAADAGPETIGDTAGALTDVGVPMVGRTPDGNPVPLFLDRHGVRVALLAFDVSGAGTPGIGGWDPALARGAVEAARSDADLVLTSIHGGIPYHDRPGPAFARAARVLARAGADVVWGHGPHVAHPVRVLDIDGRPAVVATSLGNLVFDPQAAPATDRGLLLEVLASAEGPLAFRIGDVALQEGRSRFVAWREPSGDAVAHDGQWWSPLNPVRHERQFLAGRRVRAHLDPSWDVEAALRGDVDADGRPELVVLFRDPYRTRQIYDAFGDPRARFVDAHGRVVRLAIYDAGLRPRWIGSLVARPVAGIAVCDGSLAVSYRRLNDPGVTGTGLWRWDLFGFISYANLRGPGEPGCGDLDRDGSSEPVITRRERS